jgi:glyoxylase-like metal-dependent hydrolase (beta-lactamase superfamily II)
MQEIAANVFIETDYEGVTLGAIRSTQGLLLIDSPFKPDDTRAWRLALLNLGAGAERLLINLDAHFDRTLGTRAMESTVIGTDRMAAVFKTRSVTFKTQHAETGADWEQGNAFGTIRWAPPEISFSERMEIQWEQFPIMMEYHPGPASGSAWVHLPEQKILFVGDAVLANQPPFLSYADMEAWKKSLDDLALPQYRDHLIIGGRNGLVNHKDIQRHRHFLDIISEKLFAMSEQKLPVQETERLVPGLLREYRIPAEKMLQSTHRLRWGLYQFYARHYNPASVEAEDQN